MKKVIQLLIAISLLLVFPISPYASDGHNPKDLQELEGDAAVIVKGILNDDAEELTRGEKEKWYDGATISTMQVVTVYKGDIKEGDVVKLAEDYWSMIVDGRQLRNIGLHDYMPSKPGKEYIFFLKAPSYDPNVWLPDCYMPIRREYGRYPVPASNACLDSLTNEELNLDPDESPKIYLELYQAVLNKYNAINPTNC